MFIKNSTYSKRKKIFISLSTLFFTGSILFIYSALLSPQIAELFKTIASKNTSAIFDVYGLVLAIFLGALWLGIYIFFNAASAELTSLIRE